MKNRIIFATVLSLSVLVLLTSLYVGGENPLKERHTSALKLLSEEENLVIWVNKELLKGQNFQLSEYDSVSRYSRALTAHCLESMGLFDKIGDEELQEAKKVFCDDIELFNEGIERFKSQYSIHRNSVFALGEVYTRFEKGETSELKEMVSSLFVHRHTEVEELKSRVDLLIQEIERQFPAGSEEFVTAQHARRVLQSRQSLSEILKNMPGLELLEDLENVRKRYLRYYDIKSAQANSKRLLLFAISILFLFAILLAVALLFQKSRELQESNDNLEERVAARTAELEASHRLVQEQHQAVVSSAKLSALGEMAGQIAHEMNTPLGAVTLTVGGLVSRLQKRKFDESHFIAQLGLVAGTVEKLSKIVNSVRMFATKEASEARQLVVVRELIEDSLLLCEGRFVEHEVEKEIIYDIDPERKVECRPTEIKHVATHLINNAIDSVSGSSCDQRWIRIRVKENAEELVFAISDGGGSVSAVDHTMIFEPKFSAKSLADGTGLGLFSSLQIIEGHRGQLRLDNSSADTTFVFSLPKKWSHGISL